MKPGCQFETRASGKWQFKIKVCEKQTFFLNLTTFVALFLKTNNIVKKHTQHKERKNRRPVVQWRKKLEKRNCTWKQIQSKTLSNPPLFLPRAGFCLGQVQWRKNLPLIKKRNKIQKQPLLYKREALQKEKSYKQTVHWKKYVFDKSPYPG